MKRSIKIITALAICGCFAFALPQKKGRRVINVVIDAGHGGKDFGATHSTLTEKKMVSDIADKIKILNRDNAIELHFTRVDDEYVSLSDRVAMINKLSPDVVISLHINSKSDENSKGMEFFVSPDSEKAQNLAEDLADKFKEKHYTVAKVKKASFYLLKNTAAPVIIVELGYMDNEQERLLLTTAAGQNSVAQTILEFLNDME